MSPPIQDRASACIKDDETDDGLTLNRVARPLTLYCRALHGRGLRIAVRADRLARRVTFSEGRIWIPESFPGVPQGMARRLFFAAAAHVVAHREHSRKRFPVGGLKPLQVAIVGAIEDARVESLAMRRFPGLGRLWRPFHVARPLGKAETAEALLARLARALIDPACNDSDPWVRKGRALFESAGGDLEDPAVSRRIGNLLGNDLGQMRVQFSAKTYVVEPAYRDDNIGLWDFGGRDMPDDNTAETIFQTARVVRKEAQGAPDRHDTLLTAPPPGIDGGGKASPGCQELAVTVARYPEWDFLLSIARPDWVTVVDTEIRPGDPGTVEDLLDRHSLIVHRTRELFRRSAIGNRTRLRRQMEGEQVDLDSCIEAAVDWRLKLAPDPRIYRADRRRGRDMSVLLLLDTSLSTGDAVVDGTATILELERGAAALMASALAKMDDPFAIGAFCSNGRGDVRYQRVKGFQEDFDYLAMARLAGLSSALSTRIGAAVRHAGMALKDQQTSRRLLLMITDGEPADVDVADPMYLVEDARKAVHELGSRGIDVFCIGLDPKGRGYMNRIFGTRNILILENVRSLPERLAQIYLRLRT